MSKALTRLKVELNVSLCIGPGQIPSGKFLENYHIVVSYCVTSRNPNDVKFHFLCVGRFSGLYLQAFSTQPCPDMLCRAQIFDDEYMERGYASVCVSFCLREIELI